MKIIDLPEPFAVVCHDAGAANHIFAWLDRDRPNCRLHLHGPARALWGSRGGRLLAEESLDECLRGSRAALTGTGWGSDLEHAARIRSHELGLRTAAVVDHWVNYPQRFSRGERVVLPDEIWVTDTWARDIARSCFGQMPLKVKPNAYLESMVSTIRSTEAATDDVLVVMEPARDDWGRGVPGEFQALDYLMSRRGVLDLPTLSGIRLRPHPSDASGKYVAWLEGRRGQGIRLDESASLEEAISGCRFIAGMQSYALVVALASGRRVFSILPPWAPALCLPQPGIVEIRKLSGAP